MNAAIEGAQVRAGQDGKPPRKKSGLILNGKKRGELIFLVCMLALPILQWLIFWTLLRKQKRKNS